MQKWMFHFGTVLATFLVIGCESRFVESSPASVNLEGTPLELRLSEKARVDARVKEVQSGAEKAKRIIQMFKKIQNPSLKENAYTPLDFLIDLNNELKMKLPEHHNNVLARKVQIFLPKGTLPGECNSLEVLLTKTEINDDSKDKKSSLGDRLTYSVRPCGTTEDFLPIVEADWVHGQSEFRFLNKNLTKIFQTWSVSEVEKNSTCKIQHNTDKIVEFIHCENFEVTISPSETATIHSMAFSNSGEIRFEAEADIFENNIKKARATLKVFRNSEVDFKIKNVEQLTSEAKNL